MGVKGGCLEGHMPKHPSQQYSSESLVFFKHAIPRTCWKKQDKSVCACGE